MTVTPLTQNKKFDLVKAIDETLFVPRSPVPLAFFRIGFGLLVFCSFGCVYPSLSDLFGPHAVPRLDAERGLLHFYPVSLFFLLPQSDLVTFVLWLLLMVSALLVCIGLFSRWASISMYLLVVSFCQRNTDATSATDDLISCLSFLLMFTNCGAVCSLDAWRRGLRTYEQQWQIKVMPWAQWLAQMQVALFYFQSVVYKLCGLTWWHGTAVYYALSLREYKRFDLSFLYQYLWQVRLLTWGTLIIEILLFTAIWHKKYRYYAMLLGVLLHAGIEITMNIPFFELLSVVCYLLFVDADDLKRVCDRLRILFVQSR